MLHRTFSFFTTPTNFNFFFSKALQLSHLHTEHSSSLCLQIPVQIAQECQWCGEEPQSSLRVHHFLL